MTSPSVFFCHTDRATTLRRDLDERGSLYGYQIQYHIFILQRGEQGRKTNAMSDEENGEVIPLTTKLSLSSSQFSAPRNGNLKRSVSSIITEDFSSSEGLSLAKQAAAALLLALAGWYYPRYLIGKEDGIEHKMAPFQKTAAGDVILDFSLNEALVNPPTISCKCRHPIYAAPQTSFSQMFPTTTMSYLFLFC